MFSRHRQYTFVFVLFLLFTIACGETAGNTHVEAGTSPASRATIAGEFVGQRLLDTNNHLEFRQALLGVVERTKDSHGYAGCGLLCEFLIKPLAPILIDTGSDAACELAATAFFIGVGGVCEECVPEEALLEPAITIICTGVGEGTAEFTEDEAEERLGQQLGCQC